MMSTHREDRLLARQSLQNRTETVPHLHLRKPRVFSPLRYSGSGVDRKPLTCEDAHLRIGWIQNGFQASNSIVRRRLKEAGLMANVALKKFLLTAVHDNSQWHMQIGLGLICQLCFGVMSQDSLPFKMMDGCL